jgi:heme a synthase
MSDSALTSQYPASKAESSIDKQKNVEIQTQMRRSIWKIAFATLLLMAVGSATRVMNAGLACPDWPLCYGQLVPTQQMNLQVFLEWFHRLDAALIGLSTLLLVGSAWWFRQQLPRWLPWATTFALSLILVQGALGAFTVTELLRFDIVTAHLGTALLFFITLLTIGTCLLPSSQSPSLPCLDAHNLAETKESMRRCVASMVEKPDRSKPLPVSPSPYLPLAAAIFVYVQSILGALVGSRWALHQCFGNSELCTVMNSHLLGVVPATLSCVAVVVVIWRNPNLPKYYRSLANLTGGLLLAQIVLGVATFKLHLQVETLTVTHQAIGAILLGTLVVLTVLLWRIKNSQPMDYSDSTVQNPS